MLCSNAAWHFYSKGIVGKKLKVAIAIKPACVKFDKLSLADTQKSLEDCAMIECRERNCHGSTEIIFKTQ
jgi:hypothetical protein